MKKKELELKCLNVQTSRVYISYGQKQCNIVIWLDQSDESNRMNEFFFLIGHINLLFEIQNIFRIKVKIWWYRLKKQEQFSQNSPAYSSDRLYEFSSLKHCCTI